MTEIYEHHLCSDDTGLYQEVPLDSVFMSVISDAYIAMKSAGYDPYLQLTGYIRTGNERYITRSGNARALVTKLDREMIKTYLKKYAK